LHGTIRAIGAALLAGVLVAGCGGGDQPDVSVVPQQSSSFATGNGVGTKPPLEILKAAEAAFRSARSIRVKNLDNGGTPQVLSDVVMTRNGAKGWVLQNGIKIQFIRVQGHTYLRSRAWWTKLDPIFGKAVGDRWAKDDSMPSFGVELTISEFADKLLAPLAGNPEPTFKGKSMVTVDGRPAVRVTSFSGTYDVAATDRPYPLQVVIEGEAGEFEFSEHDRTVRITAPKGAVDLDKPITIPARG
jgi:hypothetical protein